MGYVNGVLVTRLRLPPFIVTLGTLYVFQALKLWYSGSESIRNVDTEATAPLLIFFGNVIIGGGLPDTLRNHCVPAPGHHHVLCAEAHGLGPSCLCRGR